MAELDFYRDLYSAKHNYDYYLETKIASIQNEIDQTRRLPIQTQSLPQTQQQGQLPIQPQSLPQTQQRPSGSISIESLLNPQCVGVFITTSRLTVSSFVRSMIMNLRPFFSAIMPLVLSALVIISTPFIIEIYTMLINIVSEHIMLTISMLFSVLYFLIRLLLMIRRAKNSAVLYDRFFNFAANHYSSGILYFFILLLSVGLVYCCVCDCNCVCGCTISCDAPRA